MGAPGSEPHSPQRNTSLWVGARTGHGRDGVYTTRIGEARVGWCALKMRMLTYGASSLP